MRPVFTITTVHIEDDDGWMVACASCGGSFFDVAIYATEEDRVECSNPECGCPILPAANIRAIRPGG